MQITLRLPPDAEQQLIAVARTTSGSPTPTQEQLDSAFGALAHWALKRAYEQVSTPERVTGPLPASLAKTLARALGVILLLALLFLTPGCMVARYTRLPACACQGTNNLAPGGVRFAVYSCLMNEKAGKISVDKFTGKTHSGITIGAIDNTVDDEAFRVIVETAVKATIKAILGL